MQHKNPAWFQIHAGFYCEPEGLSPDGGLYYTSNMELYQTGEPRGLLPSGGKTPAKLHVCRASPAPYGRGVGSRGNAPCASRRACRPTAVFTIQATWSYTKPASREARRRAAVKPRPSSMSVERPPHPMGAGWGQGALPLVRAMRPVAEWRSFLFNKQGEHTKPASREARCRAAVTPQPSRMSFECSRALWARSGVQGVTPCAQSERGLSPLGCRRGDRCPGRDRSRR